MNGIDFGLSPAEAIEFFRGKGYQIGFDWRDVDRAEHDRAFTVAKMMQVDLLADVRAAVDAAVADGTTVDQFRKDLQPYLERMGWWGRTTAIDPLTGNAIDAQLGSARRLEVIFDTNIKTAYAAGQWDRIEATKADAPFLMYDAVDDGRTRPEHAAWDETVLPSDHGWWKTRYPPNGWGCRCSVIQLSQDDLDEMGVKPTERPKSFGSREWENPRTGETRKVPVGIDPGWDYHVGRNRDRNQRRLVEEKAKALPQDMQPQVSGFLRVLMRLFRVRS